MRNFRRSTTPCTEMRPAARQAHRILEQQRKWCSWQRSSTTGRARGVRLHQNQAKTSVVLIDDDEARAASPTIKAAGARTAGQTSSSDGVSVGRIWIGDQFLAITGSASASARPTVA